MRLHPAALLILLTAGAAPAQVRVELAGPGRVLDPEEPWLLQPLVTGAGDRTACHWSVTEAMEPAADARLEPHGERGAIFSASGGRRPRRFLVRATAQEDPDAYAVAEVVVASDPHRGGRPAPFAETKAALPPEPGPFLWATRFNRDALRNLNAIAWDRPAGARSLLALEWEDSHSRLVAITPGGEETEVVARPAAGQSLHADCAAMAALADGSVLVADPAHHRIARIRRDGAKAVLETYAGTGETQANGDQDRLAANLDRPTGIAVAADGTVLFCDAGQRLVRRITAAGRVETVAGSGAPAPEVLEVFNDLRALHPATATDLVEPLALAAAPDGRIILLDGGLGHPALLALRPDRTLALLAEETGTVKGLAVTARNEVAYLANDRSLRLIGASGRRETRVRGCLGDDGPMGRALLAPAQAGLAGMACLAPAPGGGLLALDPRAAQIWHLGPSRDALLAKRVQAALAALAEGDAGTVRRIRAGLVERVQGDPAGLLGRRTRLAARPGAAPLPDDLRDLVRSFLEYDPGLAFRVRVALDVLDLAAAGAGLPGKPFNPWTRPGEEVKQ